MNIAFLCGLYPKNSLEKIIKNSKGSVDHAANTLQWTILEGLTNFNLSISVFTLPFIRTFPVGYRKAFVRKTIFFWKTNIKICNVGFNNLLGYQFLSRYFNARKNLYNWTKVSILNRTIIVYNIHTPFLKAVIDVKKRFPDVKICLIVPDLPEFMSENKNILYRTLKSIDYVIIKKLLKHIDCFVLLTDTMAKALKIDKPWVRIEGIFDSFACDQIVQKDFNKSILYSGTLNKRYGIMNLVRAFNLIEDDNYRLWICGDGNCRNDIIKIAETNPHIIYFGQITRDKVLILQKKATVLVNPRTSEGVYTKYSFPSKTMEYLASGTPTILYRLEGIPEEYYNYCFTVEGETEMELKKSIVNVCERDQNELKLIGKKASYFINNKKNATIQVSKIINLINSLNKTNN